MHAVLEHVAEIGVVAILRGVDPSILVPLGQALEEAGVGAIEITLNSEGALKGIAALKEAIGEKLPIGAGTVMTGEDAHAAIKAGATFVLTPHLAEETLAVCCQAKIPAVIGVMTPSEIVRAYDLGCEMVKIFPASSLGANYFRELRGPLPQIATMAVGGVNKDNAVEFIKAGAMAVGAGGQLVDFAAAARGDWDAVTRKAKEIVTAVYSAKNRDL
ncbi:bifunctional 4-hydroxy-2-oxoglutarate aldolase/2-dehydro-3-deoxy-phosphogluconate aldolase [Pelosinus sp. IPA-1]|jgi:2-dehydro-3-deoxyphosphogluconate aldolase/(4S)-4-hydroxy-2-oxoglutarate aldolase|uniref:bifunctional 4-hydroxy-2-oxoglutarate aldolase/2-dehydro-3-deoxy-phosphogluconate aldolase n=1 Tax=Pelosinus sp. IPA-1 TaxID=3029569 RepID=UPI00243619C6|nr:bifunctional 4-hydroxy-2-oxoglutarate aldolase/2-dehydro-3-deoxy-phosphogluconate aldolase [Pelosinus sp. IPA-1]GMA98984.1 2-dehydro-3-deoxy-phosphogluconate aldolase [Pelosinus sp. IPA-1]